MPPKETAKKTKKQLKQEADEKKRLEEESRKAEELRLKAENERLDLERRTKIKSLLLKDEARMEAEKLNGIQAAADCINRLTQSISQRFELDNWKRYLDCETVTDLLSERAIQTFISIWQADSDKHFKSINDATRHLSVAEGVCLALFEKLCELRGFGVGAYDSMLIRLIQSIMEIVSTELDRLTLKLLNGTCQSESAGDMISFQTKFYSCDIYVNGASKLETVAFHANSVVLAFPKSFRDLKVAVRCFLIRAPFNSILSNSNDIMVDPILDVQCFELPAKSVARQGWTISRVEKLKVIEMAQPISCRMKVESLTAPVDKCRLLHLNELTLNWISDGISDSQYTREAAQVKFDFDSFGKFAMSAVVDGYVKSWSCRSSGNDLLLNVAHSERGVFEILVSEAGCKLAKEGDSFVNAASFKQQMKQRGIAFNCTSEKKDDKLPLTLSLIPHVVEISYVKVPKGQNMIFGAKLSDDQLYTICEDLEWKFGKEPSVIYHVSKGTLDNPVFRPDMAAFGSLLDAFKSIVPRKAADKPFALQMTQWSVLSALNLI